MDEKLIKAAQEYYNGRPEIMSDSEYDARLKREKDLNPKFSIFDYITYEDDHVKVKHDITIPVWKKYPNKWELLESESPDLICTPKYDGCSIVAYYDTKGNLSNILTRSNEVEGLIQTNKLRNKVPQKVDPHIKAVLFEAICRESRQKANGLINSKYKQEEVDKLIELMPFDAVPRNPILGYVDRMRLAGVTPRLVDRDEALYIRDHKTTKDGIPADGVVCYSASLPSCNTESAFIIKTYGDEDADTEILDIIPVLSTDTLTFSTVFRVDTVTLNNTKVSNIGNAGGWDTIKEKGLGVGAQVKVELAKLVIPKIKKVLVKSDVKMPTCPYCGSPLIQFESKLICDSQDCNSYREVFTRVFLEYTHNMDDKLFKNGVNDVQRMKNFWQPKCHIDFVKLVRNDFDFYWKCISAPRLKPEYVPSFSTKVELVDFIKRLTPSQQHYVKHKLNKLKIFIKELEV